MANMQDWIKYAQAQGTPNSYGAWTNLVNSFGGDMGAANQFVNWGQQNGGANYLPTVTTPSASMAQSMLSGVQPGTLLGANGLNQQQINAFNGGTGAATNAGALSGSTLPTNGSWNVNGNYQDPTQQGGTGGVNAMGLPTDATINTPKVPNTNFSPYFQNTTAAPQAPVNAVGPLVRNGGLQANAPAAAPYTGAAGVGVRPGVTQPPPGTPPPPAGSGANPGSSNVDTRVINPGAIGSTDRTAVPYAGVNKSAAAGTGYRFPTANWGSFAGTGLKWG